MTSTESNDNKEAMYNAWISGEKARIMREDPAAWETASDTTRKIFDMIRDQNVDTNLREIIVSAIMPILQQLDEQKKSFETTYITRE